MQSSGQSVSRYVPCRSSWNNVHCSKRLLCLALVRCMMSMRTAATSGTACDVHCSHLGRYRVLLESAYNSTLSLCLLQDERKKICPRSALDKALAGLGASESFQCDDTVAASLCLLSEHMLEQTMEFGALMASRRQSKWMEVCCSTHTDASQWAARHWLTVSKMIGCGADTIPYSFYSALLRIAPW